MTKNVLYCGENLEILATMERESVDLIYIDPPFFSNRYYEIIWGDEAEQPKFWQFLAVFFVPFVLFVPLVVSLSNYFRGYPL